MNGNRSNRSLFRQLLTVASSLSLSLATLIAAPSATLLPALAAQPQTNATLEPHQNSVTLWPGACTTATWNPTGGTMAVRSGVNQVSAVVTANIDLNAATAQYQIVQPGSAAGAWQPVSSVTTISSKSILLRVNNPPVTPPTAEKLLTTIQFRVTPVDNSPYVCSEAYSLLATASAFFMPYVGRVPAVTVVDITTASEPDNNVCQAGYTLQAGQRYVARMSDTNDFYKIVVTQKATLNFTVDNFTQVGQVQLRSLVGVNCASNLNVNGTLFNSTSFQSTPSASRSLVVPNVDPGTYYLRIVLTSGANPPNTDYQMLYTTSAAITSPYEPNNTPCTAAPITSGTLIGAYPDDENDWYVLTTNIRTNIVFTATHPNTNMQYLIYATASDCTAITSNAQLVTYDGGKTSVTLNVNAANAGKYFVRVAPTGGYRSSTSAYLMRITATSALATQSTQEQSASEWPSDQPPAPFDLTTEPIP